MLDMQGAALADNTYGAFAPDGELAAMAYLLFVPSDEEQLALMLILLHDQHRGHGLSDFIMEWLEARARIGFAAEDDEKPQLVRMSVEDAQEDRISLLERHGFRAARYAHEMKRDLGMPIPAIRLETGVEMIPWRDELTLTAMAAFNKAFEGHWGVSTLDEKGWNQWFIGVPHFRGDLSLLVTQGEQVVGLCINWINEARNRQRGIEEGWIEALGVIPAWRGRGIARALLALSMTQFKGIGMSQAALDVDVQNPSGALRLYEKMGFTLAKRTVHYLKQLA